MGVKLLLKIWHKFLNDAIQSGETGEILALFSLPLLAVSMRSKQWRNEGHVKRRNSFELMFISNETGNLAVAQFAEGLLLTSEDLQLEPSHWQF